MSRFFYTSFFAVLEDIIQNQPLLTQYLGDPELGPLLLHVARIVLDKPSSSTTATVP